MTKLYNLADRISNRLMRHLPVATLEVPSQTPTVSFTFDDAPDSALTTGAQILEAHGVRGTFYIAGGLAGRTEPVGTMISSVAGSSPSVAMKWAATPFRIRMFAG
jgi:peptidoglycan/xylan/chitin deacetylase (PgdA/CDA1 family)